MKHKRRINGFMKFIRKYYKSKGEKITIKKAKGEKITIKKVRCFCYAKREML